jgi:hypothetical protein
MSSSPIPPGQNITTLTATSPSGWSSNDDAGFISYILAIDVNTRFEVVVFGYPSNTQSYWQFITNSSSPQRFFNYMLPANTPVVLSFSVCGNNFVLRANGTNVLGITDSRFSAMVTASASNYQVTMGNLYTDYNSCTDATSGSVQTTTSEVVTTANSTKYIIIIIILSVIAALALAGIGLFALKGTYKNKQFK